MSKTASVLGGAITCAGAAAFVLAGASAAAAGTAVDVPAQVFAQSQAGSKPVAQWKLGADVSTQARDWAVGRSFRVNVPLGAGQKLPLRVHVYSSEEECHDNMAITAVAANRDQDFMRGGDH